MIGDSRDTEVLVTNVSGMIYSHTFEFDGRFAQTRKILKVMKFINAFRLNDFKMYTERTNFFHYLLWRAPE